MPVRPENRARYPKDWPTISATVRDEAGNRCEECHVENYARGGRSPDGRFWPALPTGENSLGLMWPREGEYAWCSGWPERLRIIRIVLTVAHLNHQPEDVSRENLRALWCDLPSDVRAMRCDAARQFVSFLEANGFTVQRLTTTKEIANAGHNDPA